MSERGGGGGAAPRAGTQFDPELVALFAAAVVPAATELV